MNNLFQQLNPQLANNSFPQTLASNPKSLPLKSNNMLSSLLNSSNPNDFLQKMISNNPQMQNLMQIFKSSGKTPKQFFYQYAQQKGINPDQFLNSLIKE